MTFVELASFATEILMSLILIGNIQEISNPHLPLRGKDFREEIILLSGIFL